MEVLGVIKSLGYDKHDGVNLFPFKNYEFVKQVQLNLQKHSFYIVVSQHESLIF